MGKKTKLNNFRPTLENLETREMMSVSPLPITQPNSIKVTSLYNDASSIVTTASDGTNSIKVTSLYNDAADINEAIAKDKDNTVDEAINLGKLLEGKVVEKKGVISFGAMPKTPKQPSWGQYSALNSRDVDLYKFTVEAGDRVTFKFNTTEESTIWQELKNGKLINVEKKYSLGLDAELYDSLGNQAQLLAEGPIGKLHGDSRNPSILEHTFNKAGTYYLGIASLYHNNYNILTGKQGSRNSLNSSIGPYSLSVSVKKDLPEFQAVNLRFDDSRTSLLFDYKISQANFDRNRPKEWKHNIGLYWTDTNGNVISEIKNHLIDGFNNSTNFNLTQSKKIILSREITFTISLKDLGKPPNDLATHVRFVVNSGNKIPELNVSNNFKDMRHGLIPSGVYVFCKDVYPNQTADFYHQYLVLIPNNPEMFSEAKDLGNGQKGIILGAYARGNLVADVFDMRDSLSAKEFVTQNPNQTYKTQIEKVQLKGADIDGEIRKLLKSFYFYKSITAKDPIPYPSMGGLLGGYNSNSWAQSIIYHVIGNDRLSNGGNFKGDDIGWDRKIPWNYFLSGITYG